MNRIRVAVAGYGNIGKYAVKALKNAPDMELAGVVRRCGSAEGYEDELAGCKVCADIRDLGKVDAVILATPSRKVEENALKYLQMGINTVDSFDIHQGIWDLKCKLDPVAREHGAVSVISSGWDPGSDSVIRTLVRGLVPDGVTYTNFGPGRSMGHTVVAASKPGVKKALSLTIPLGEGRHKREVYIELEPGAEPGDVKKSILEDPYFSSDPTEITVVDNVDSLDTLSHGVRLERGGICFDMRIINPELTANVLIMAARASVKQKPGCYTMIEIPPVDFLDGTRENLIRELL